MSALAAATPPKSTFVTAVAWVFIVLAGIATLISLLQNLMLNVFLLAAPMDQAVEQARNDPKVPEIAVYLFENIRWIFAGFLAVCVATLTLAIGLLLRRNWARLGFIALMVLGILWNVGGVAVAAFFMDAFVPVPPGTPEEAVREFRAFSTVVVAVNTVFALAFSVLFGWIAMRLGSGRIRREFGAAGEAGAGS